MMNPAFVGREGELAEMRALFDKARAGNGQVCFVTGQAGSGKSALVGRFLQEMLAEHPDVVVATGACNSQSGIGVDLANSGYANEGEYEYEKT